mgnify:FL=1
MMPDQCVDRLKEMGFQEEPLKYPDPHVRKFVLDGVPRFNSANHPVYIRFSGFPELSRERLRRNRFSIHKRNIDAVREAERWIVARVTKFMNAAD